MTRRDIIQEYFELTDFLRGPIHFRYYTIWMKNLKEKTQNDLSLTRYIGQFHQLGHSSHTSDTFEAFEQPL